MPVASTYQASDGAAYEIFLGRWTKQLAPRLLDFASFAPDGPLLDVGTGTGSLAFAMRRGGRPAAFSASISPSPISNTRAHGPKGGRRISKPATQRRSAFMTPHLPVCRTARAQFRTRRDRRSARNAPGDAPRRNVAAAVWDFRGGLVYQRLFWDTAAGIDRRAGQPATGCFPARSPCPMVCPGCSARRASPSRASLAHNPHDLCGFR